MESAEVVLASREKGNVLFGFGGVRVGSRTVGCVLLIQRAFSVSNRAISDWVMELKSWTGSSSKAIVDVSV